jgi:hypothetical protein
MLFDVESLSLLLINSTCEFPVYVNNSLNKVHSTRYELGYYPSWKVGIPTPPGHKFFLVTSHPIHGCSLVSLSLLFNYLKIVTLYQGRYCSSRAICRGFQNNDPQWLAIQWHKLEKRSLDTQDTYLHKVAVQPISVISNGVYICSLPHMYPTFTRVQNHHNYFPQLSVRIISIVLSKTVPIVL